MVGSDGAGSSGADELLSAEEAAHLLGINRSYFYKLRLHETIPSKRVGVRRQKKFRRVDIVERNQIHDL